MYYMPETDVCMNWLWQLLFTEKLNNSLNILQLTSVGAGLNANWQSSSIVYAPTHETFQWLAEGLIPYISIEM